MSLISKNEKIESDEIDCQYTKIIITNSNNFLPSDLAIHAYSFSLPVNLKETCFGLVITGLKKDVEFISKNLQKLDENYIFIKDRGFPAGDKRRCRAHRNGGSRPGFYTLYEEIKTLPYITQALNKYNMRSSFEKTATNIEQKVEPKYIKNLINKHINY